jgi:hypothetical protein
MKSLEVIYWFCAGLILYGYIGQGILFWLLGKLKNHKK